ncbi:MAG: hypothetical protein J6K00_01545, partial [Oscillospiraceae bacterium]|nr:hypothetical protein [Oscillospiraceae bacterium]
MILSYEDKKQSLVRIASRYKQTGASPLRRPCVCADKPPQRLFPVAAAAATKNLFSAGAGGRKRRGRKPARQGPAEGAKAQRSPKGRQGGARTPPTRRGRAQRRGPRGRPTAGRGAARGGKGAQGGKAPTPQGSEGAHEGKGREAACNALARGEHRESRSGDRSKATPPNGRQGAKPTEGGRRSGGNA